MEMIECVIMDDTKQSVFCTVLGLMYDNALVILYNKGANLKVMKDVL